MPKQITNREACSFTPSTLISLFTLNGAAIGLSDVFYFCDGAANNFRPIVFDGVTYSPLPVKMEEMTMSGQGQVNRPKISIANIRGLISLLMLDTQSLVGAKITRRRVFARFIDNINFPKNKNPYGDPDPTAAYNEEVFLINRKVAETQQLVTWELSTPFELDGVKLPRRQILANSCQFPYRDAHSCKYTGEPIADKNNKKFVGGAGTYGLSSLNNRGGYSSSETYNAGDYVYIYSNLPELADIPIYCVCLVDGTSGIVPFANTGNWVMDVCSKSIAGCKIRFPSIALRGSFFPGVSIAPFIVSR